VIAPFVPHTESEIAAMLADLGLDSLEDLFATVPDAVRLAGGLDLPDHQSEADVLERLEELGEANRPIGRAASGEARERRSLVCFAGAGAYDHEVPAVVRSLASRSEFVTAYTPYQPEVAQGVLQAIFEYQTMIARLAGLEVANGSLYDGAASLLEGANLAVAATGNERVICSAGVNPRWRSVLETFSRGSGHEVEIVPLSGGLTDWASVGKTTRTTLPGTAGSAAGGKFAAGAVVVGFPNFLGYLEDLAAARAVADAAGARLVVCVDPVASGLLKTPGALGADVVVGEGQPLGIALSFGGPYLGLFACRLADVRRLPGRLVGETVDADGKRAYVTTLRAREQDIRREKASSNVCTNQTLLAVTAAIQLGWLGLSGLREVALRSARAARYLHDSLVAIEGVEPLTDARFLREFALQLPVDAEVVIERLVHEGYLAGVPVREGFSGTDAEGCLLVAATERRTRAEIDGFAGCLEKVIR
jgi:glycine dehydrogenase subunit 1